MEQSEHIKVVNRLNKEIESLKSTIQTGIITHNVMTDRLNTAVLLLKEHNLLEEYYRRTK